MFNQLLFPCFLGLGSGQYSGDAERALHQAQQVSGQLGSTASAEGAQLNPFLSQEMRAVHGLTPGQMGEELTAAEAGSGAAAGAAKGELLRNAARTGNATGVTKTLEEMSRNQGKTAAGASEGIAAQDVAGAKALNQAGAAGMEGLYGENLKGQLNAMGQQSTDIDTAIKAAQQGPSWLTGLGQVAGAIGDVSKIATSAGALASGPGASSWLT